MAFNVIQNFFINNKQKSFCPIVGSKGLHSSQTQCNPNANNDSNNNSMNQLFNSLAINTGFSGNRICGSSSPINTTLLGSALKYSPDIWPQSVDSVKSQPIGSKYSEAMDDFASNGRDVPIDGNEFGRQSPPNAAMTSIAFNEYQLFGTNRFNFAETKSSTDKKSEPIETNIGFEMKPKFVRSVTQTYCSFCKNNNETEAMYASHVIKDSFGKTTCPVLRKYDCPICKSGGGDNGHTIRYCPMNRRGAEAHIPSVIRVMKTGRSADGRKRIV